MTTQYNVAILGATGAVGEILIELLEGRKFPVDKLFLLASARSAGDAMMFRNRPLEVQDVNTFDFSQVQIAFFTAGSEVSKQYIQKATDAGCIVIDNTAAFRYEDDIPLIVPEVNRHAIAQYKTRGIIANPNCSTSQMVVALKPIYDAVGIDRINVATYQSVSGTGQEAIEELAHQTAALMNGKSVKAKIYPKQIAFNLIPHIDDFQENGYTKEEMKMVWETQKIFDDPHIKVNATTVRVPVFYGHSEAVHIETKQKISAEKTTELLKHMPGITIVDRQKAGGYPTPVEAAGKDPVFVGRIREDISHPRGINMWIVADNLRKGAALNSVQIAECLIADYI